MQTGTKKKESVKEKLATPYGLMLCAPPFVKTRSDIMSSVVFLPGIKPQYDGLLIDPCIKHDWDGYTVERV